MDSFGRKSLPNLVFATFYLFTAFLADAFGKVRKATGHRPSIVHLFTTRVAKLDPTVDIPHSSGINHHQLDKELATPSGKCLHSEAKTGMVAAE